jgi:hypothetical protein
VLVDLVTEHNVTSLQGGGCDPYFDIRLGDGKQLMFDWKKACKGKIKNYQSKHKVIDFDLSAHNIRVKVWCRTA